MAVWNTAEWNANGGGAPGVTITARNLIYDALRQLGAMRPGQGPSADAIADYLRILNQLIDSWNAERLMQRVAVREETPTTAGDTSFTFGPAKIEAAGYIAGAGASEYRLRILTPGEWADIADKTAQGTPSALFTNYGDPEQTVNLYRIPDAAGTLVTYTSQRLDGFTDADTEFGLPAGYARALLYNLASDMAPAVVIHTKIQLGAVLLGSIERKAAESKGVVKSANIRPMLLECDPALLESSFDIYRGY